MDERNCKATARQRLQGSWGTSMLAGFLAYWLGGLIVSGGSVNLNLYKDALEDIIDWLPMEGIRMLLGVLCFLGFLALVNFIIGGVINLGYAKFLLAQHDGREYRVGDLFSQFHRFGTGFAQFFLRNLYIVLWSLLFLIPGIIKSLSYAMTPFILAEHPEMTASEAIRTSRRMMDGHKGDLFVLHLSFIGWNLLSMFTFGIAGLWVTPYFNAAYAAFYRQLTGKPELQIESAKEDILW